LRSNQPHAIRFVVVNVNKRTLRFKLRDLDSQAVAYSYVEVVAVSDSHEIYQINTKVFFLIQHGEAREHVLEFIISLLNLNQLE